MPFSIVTSPPSTTAVMSNAMTAALPISITAPPAGNPPRSNADLVRRAIILDRPDEGNTLKGNGAVPALAALALGDLDLLEFGIADLRRRARVCNG